MQPIVTPEEMAAIDEAAPEPVEVLIARAGAAVTLAAVAMLGGTYGRRLVVLAGKGNNGNDGRDAARRLARRGARVEVVDVADGPERLEGADLVIDAAFGTGFRGEWVPPDVDAPVLAVDIPSGVSGLTGEVGGAALRAERTVTFAALKPGLLFPPGSLLAGAVEVADIGLDTSGARAHRVTDDDLPTWLPGRAVDAHKWHHAVAVIGGSPGMTGAAALTARAAFRAGAGYVRSMSPGDEEAGGPVEAVTVSLPSVGWAGPALDSLDRVGAAVVGPGLGARSSTLADAATVIDRARVPLVVDGDGLRALARIRGQVASTVVATPHDGEYEVLAGERPGPDRIDAARRLADRLGAVVLLKGPATVVAAPDGEVLVVDAGDARLATAGSGDVLSGIIGALLAHGVTPLRAAAAGAHLHGRAAALGPARGLMAGDVADLLPDALAALRVP